MSGWQPIETAPKVGRFLVYGGRRCGEVRLPEYEGRSGLVALIERGDRAKYGLGAEPEWPIADAEYYSPHVEGPTHWMPPPEPPQNPA